MTQKADLIGRKFGHLTVKEQLEERQNGYIVWRCSCGCGGEIRANTRQLLRGTVTSCGCMREEIQKNVPNLLHRMDGTCVEWLEKRKSRSDNTSGFRGVFSEKNGKFRAAIGFKRQKFYIGTFDTFEEAVEARKEAEALIHDGFVKAYYDWQKKAEQDPQWAENTPLIYEVEKVNGRFRIHTNM